MAVRLDRDIKRVTLVGSDAGSQTVYQRDRTDDALPVKRITVLKRDGRGRTISRESYEAEGKSKRRGSKTLRPIERGIREFIEFESRVLDEYLTRHKRSNEKSRDGWISDMPSNVMRSVRGAKPQRLVRTARWRRDDD